MCLVENLLYATMAWPLEMISEAKRGIKIFLSSLQQLQAFCVATCRQELMATVFEKKHGIVGFSIR